MDRVDRYVVLVVGTVSSSHRTEAQAVRAARALVREADLVDDGAYCGDDGWPMVVDRREPDRRIDYPARQEE